METVAATGTVYLRPPRGQSTYLMCSARRAPVEQRFLAERFRLRGKTAPSAAQRRFKMGQWLRKYTRHFTQRLYHPSVSPSG